MSSFGQPDTALINERYREVVLALDSLHMTRVQVLSQDLLRTLAALPRDSFHINAIMNVVLFNGAMSFSCLILKYRMLNASG